MASQNVLTFRTKDDSDLNLNNPNISFREKWNKHVTQKRTKGIIRHAHVFNRWAPRLFYFVCLGGTGWIAAGSVPHYYGQDKVWMVTMEVFTVYVFLQVMVNYFLTKLTDSSYKPDVLTSGQPSPRTAYTALLQNQSAAAATSTLLEGNNNFGNYDINLTSGENSPLLSSTPLETKSAYRVLVATSVTGNDVERKSYPYWSWVPCLICDRQRPPRCHHCSLCQACVLKRDHHCYITAVCIGVNNHRYYMYFLFWSLILTWLGSLTLVPYLFVQVLDLNHYSYLNLIFPYNMYAVVKGELPILYLYPILVVWGVVFLTFVSSGMLANSSYLLLRGVTSFESNHAIKVIDARGFKGRLRSALGRNWGIVLFLTDPLSNVLARCLPRCLEPSEPLEDAVNWPYIKTT